MEVFHTIATGFMAFQLWLTDLLVAYPLWSGVILMLITAVESVPLIGNSVPGVAILTASGGLVAAGKLSLWTAIVGGTVGAIIGDAAAYQLGWHYRATLWEWPVWRRHRKLVARTHQLFARYGAWAVFICRFVPGARAFISILAGANALPPRQFYGANIVSALIWAPLHVLVGLYAIKILI